MFSELPATVQVAIALAQADFLTNFREPEYRPSIWTMRMDALERLTGTEDVVYLRTRQLLGSLDVFARRGTNCGLAA